MDVDGPGRRKPGKESLKSLRMWFLRHARARCSSFFVRRRRIRSKCSVLVPCSARKFSANSTQIDLNRHLNDLETSLFRPENVEKFKSISIYKKSTTEETLNLVNEHMDAGDVPDFESFCSFLRVRTQSPNTICLLLCKNVDQMLNRFFCNFAPRVARNKVSTHSFAN